MVQMISPCRGCKLEYVDKNNDTCMRCAKRIEYVEALEGMTNSVPVEMTDMAIHINAEKAKQHDEFILANKDMSPIEIARQLGRSTAAIYNRRHALGLTKQMRREKVRAAAEKMMAEDSRPHVPAVNAAELIRAADMMIVNVNGHEELYERLKRSAKENFREPWQQALFFIHQGLAAEDCAGDHRRAPDGAS